MLRPLPGMAANTFARLRDGRNAAGEAVTWREDENPDAQDNTICP